MSDISKIPISQLKDAAMSWRRHANKIGLFGGKPNLSLHDCIDDMIRELERLRAAFPNGR